MPGLPFWKILQKLWRKRIEDGNKIFTMKFSLSYILLASIMLLECTTKTADDTENQFVENMTTEIEFQSIIDSMFAAVPNIKGIGIHIESPDLGISWSYATGWTDKATNRKLLHNDPALIASITKTYVSAAILRLVENGNIRLDQSIGELLSKERVQQLKKAGYQVNRITVAHLNSQTSGIYDYVNTQLYQSKTTSAPSHIWTRDEQINLALLNAPEFKPGEKFAYSEINNLLLTEIIERQTGMPFYAAIRQLLGYKKHGLNNSWFNWLEKAPKNLTPLVHQFATEYKVESYGLHPSFDVYGGGGIASTTENVTKFTQLLFTGALFEKEETKGNLFKTIPTADGVDNNYHMGIAKTKVGDFTAFGHGGFWGTTTQYFPELNTSVSVFLMERDEWPKYFEILEQVAKAIKIQKSTRSKSS